MISSGDSTFTRAAASSMARGMPSRRWQICATAGAFWLVTAKPGRMAVARSMKSRTALPRQQTLRAAIDWSHRLLPDAERALFCRLSVFSGGWTLPAAEAVCGQCAAEHDILDLLTALVDKSLVLADADASGQTRYRLPETVRQYARDKLVESGLAEQARDNHHAFFLALAEEAEPHLVHAEGEAWVKRLEADHDNLRAALEWAMIGSAPEPALRLAGELWRFWYIRLYVTEAGQWLRRALAKDGEASPRARAKAVSGAGTMAWLGGDYEGAERLHRDSLALYSTLGHQADIAFALHCVATQVAAQGRLDEATAVLEEALAVARETGDPWLIAHPVLGLGELARIRGDLARARAFYEESLALARDAGDRMQVAMALNNLGMVAITEGDHEAARPFHRQALDIALEFAETRQIVGALEGLGAVFCAADEPVRGVRLLAAVDGLFEAMGHAIEPVDRPVYEAIMRAARAALTEEAFNAAWAEGRRMTMDEAVAYALGEAKSV